MIGAFIFIIMCMRVVQSVFNKKASLLIPDRIFSHILYVILSNLIASVFSLLTLITSHSFYGFNSQTIIISLFSGMFLAISSICGLKALSCGTIVLNSIFATSGLIIPCILGAIFFNEPLTTIHIICILGVLLSAVLLISSSGDLTGGFNKKTLLYLLGSFFSNGMVMFCQKLFGVLQPNGNVSLFSMLTFLLPTLILSFAAFVYTAKANKKARLPKQLILCILFLAFAVFVIQQLVTLLTPLLHSAVLFTVVNGGATIIAYIVGAVMYKEKITFKSAVGVLLGLTALIVINI